MTKPMDFDDIVKRVEQAFSGLSPQLRRAARYVIDHPDDVALYSMRQLAAHANVHPSTMVRLARELGFEGHAQFQAPFQSRLRSRPKVSYAGDARDLQERGDSGDTHALVREMIAAERLNLGAVIDDLGTENIIDAANLLGEARRIFFVGARSLYPVAFYLHYASRMFTHNVELVDGHGGTFADQLRGVGKGDVIVAVSYSPYTRTTVRAVDYATEHGAQVIAITDSNVAPIARHPGTVSLVVRNDSPSFFPSTVPAMAVAQALVMLMIARSGEEALKDLADSEEQLNGLEAYWLEDYSKGRKR